MNIQSIIIERLTPRSYYELTSGLSLELDYETIMKGGGTEFSEKHVKPTMDNLALSMQGHQPEYTFIFDESKFFNWCKLNDIEVTRLYFSRVYVLRNQNTTFWRGKFTTLLRDSYFRAIEDALLFYDMKNKSFYPTQTNQIRKVSQSTEPFIEHIYIGETLLLVWDHNNGKIIKTK